MRLLKILTAILMIAIAGVLIVTGADDCGGKKFKVDSTEYACQKTVIIDGSNYFLYKSSETSPQYFLINTQGQAVNRWITEPTQFSPADTVPSTDPIEKPILQKVTDGYQTKYPASTATTTETAPTTEITPKLTGAYDFATDAKGAGYTCPGLSTCAKGRKLECKKGSETAYFDCNDGGISSTPATTPSAAASADKFSTTQVGNMIYVVSAQTAGYIEAQAKYELQNSDALKKEIQEKCTNKKTEVLSQDCKNTVTENYKTTNLKSKEAELYPTNPDIMATIPAYLFPTDSAGNSLYKIVNVEGNTVTVSIPKKEGIMARLKAGEGLDGMGGIAKGQSYEIQTLDSGWKITRKLTEGEEKAGRTPPAAQYVNFFCGSESNKCTNTNAPTYVYDPTNHKMTIYDDTTHRKLGSWDVSKTNAENTAAIFDDCGARISGSAPCSEKGALVFRPTVFGLGIGGVHAKCMGDIPCSYVEGVGGVRTYQSSKEDKDLANYYDQEYAGDKEQADYWKKKAAQYNLHMSVTQNDQKYNVICNPKFFGAECTCSPTDTACGKAESSGTLDPKKLNAAATAVSWKNWIADARAWQSFGANVYALLEQFQVDTSKMNWPFLQSASRWFETNIAMRAILAPEQVICNLRQNFQDAAKRGYLPSDPAIGKAGADIQAFRTSVMNMTGLNETIGGSTTRHFTRYKITFDVDASALFSQDLVQKKQTGSLKFKVTLGGENIISNDTVGEIGKNGHIELDVKKGPASYGTTTLGHPIIKDFPGGAEYNKACIEFTDGTQYMSGYVLGFLKETGDKVCNTVQG